MSLNKFFNEYRCTKTDAYTHLSMYPYGGLFEIPDRETEEFHLAYQGAVNSGVCLGILERPMDYGPVLVDIDIKTTDIAGAMRRTQRRATKSGTRCGVLYSETQILRIVKAYTNTMIDTVEGIVPEELTCVVLEKPGYTKGNEYKNGFHLHFPMMWLSLEHRRVIAVLAQKKMLPEDLKLVDPCANRANWFLYGSMKNPESRTYRVSYTVKHDGTFGKLDSLGNPLVTALSIRSSPLRVDHVLRPEFTKSAIKTERSAARTKRTTFGDNEDYRSHKDLIERCMRSLAQHRADEYPEWIKIGCILKTIDPSDGLETWKDFSVRSLKYDESHLEDTWRRFSHEYNYTVGSLIHMAREDDEGFTLDCSGVRRRLLSKKHAKPIVKPYSRRELIDMCKDRNIKGITTRTKGELSDLLGIPMVLNVKYETCCRQQSGKSVPTTLTNVETKEIHKFKSIYATAKFMDRNPGSVKLFVNRVLESRSDGKKYLIATL